MTDTPRRAIASWLYSARGRDWEEIGIVASEIFAYACLIVFVIVCWAL